MIYYRVVIILLAAMQIGLVLWRVLFYIEETAKFGGNR
jgi:hypothetical protein